MKKRTSVTVGTYSTLDQLHSARSLIDELIARASEPGAEPTRKPRPRSLTALGLPKQVINALHAASIRSLDRLLDESAPSLLQIPGLGLRSVSNLQAVLAEHGLSLAEATNEQDRQDRMAGRASARNRRL
ncbi:DNA-directed RNA polymerase subunit alpha C-terminal domain-containing protein [Paraburkholderia sp. MM5477-R1]|uniref:DNA-directed RNA polymerase subunit alpha C-terminal domain-containing protein n=1 Tax=Paraburkholderia sp. MM5477-R1 TaxID=2991062 RepID=UPI003D194AE7